MAHTDTTEADTIAEALIGALRQIQQQMKDDGLAPVGWREVTLHDLVEWFGSSETWWERHRAPLVTAGVLHKVGRVYFGNLRDIQAAIGDPETFVGVATE